MEESRSTQFEGIGTHWQIDIHDALSPETVRGIFANARARIEKFEATYSRFRDGTLVDQMAHTAGAYSLPPDGKMLFDLYEKLYRATGGAVTPLIGNTLVEAGYDKSYTLQVKEMHAPPHWEDVLSYQFPTLTVHSPTQLDLGAIGKGYCIDIVGQLLEDAGVVAYTIDAGGDIRHRMHEGKTLTVGLEHPDNRKQVIGTIPLGNASICGSAGNRRAWSGVHHIINPHTHTKAEDILAVWVVAKDTMTADGLSTALFFTDPITLAKEFSFEYLRINKDWSIDHSPGFSATLFS